MKKQKILVGRITVAVVAALIVIFFHQLFISKPILKYNLHTYNLDLYTNKDTINYNFMLNSCASDEKPLFYIKDNCFGVKLYFGKLKRLHIIDCGTDSIRIKYFKFNVVNGVDYNEKIHKTFQYIKTYEEVMNEMKNKKSK